MVRLENIFMPKSASESDSLQVGKHMLSPPPLVPRAEDEQDTVVTVPTFTDPPEFADEESSNSIPGRVAASLTTPACVSLFSSVLIHLLVWGTALILLPIFGFDLLELIQKPQEPISASLGDEEILDDLPQFEVVGSVEVEMEKQESSVQQLAQHLQESNAAWLKSASEEAFSLSSVDSQGEAGDGGGILLKVPKAGFAVTKGSFTAFTIPATPEPLTPYRIVIEVRLPGDVNKYRVSDLKGEVIGTDGYKQFLPYDKAMPSATRAPAANGKEVVLTSSSSIDVIKNRVQIIIVVPGARNLVKDRIKIRSRHLREEQELTLTFGKAGTPDDDGPEKP